MKIKHYCLMTKEVTETHSAENLAEELRQGIDEWDLSDKLYAITTDNCKNIVNAVVDHLNVLHIPCIGHTLQLGVQKAFTINRVANVLGKVRKLVQHFRKSSKAMYQLRAKQTVLSLPKHELIQQCETRWGSTYAMLERFQEQQAAVCAVLLDSPNRVHWKYFPEGEDCTIIEKLLKILKPFVQATTLMSGSSYSTIGIIAPLLYKLLEKTLAITDDDSTTARSVKMEIYTDLQDRYQARELRLLFKKCAYFDPRFKDLSPFVPEDEHDDIIESIKLDMLALVPEEEVIRSEIPINTEDRPSIINNVSKDSNSPESTSVVSSDANPPKKRKIASSLFSDFSSSRHHRGNSALDIVESEIRRYNEEDLLDYDSDPLEWWGKHQHHYPTMAKLVRKLWCAPATSVRSEELFSLAGNVLSQRRNRLLPENVDRLVFLCNNINEINEVD